MTHPRARCSYLNISTMTVCDRPFSEHTRLHHNFQAQYAHKAHVADSNRRAQTCCGRFIEDVPEILASSSDEMVRRAAIDNVICIACWKVFLFNRDRQNFLLNEQVARLRLVR